MSSEAKTPNRIHDNNIATEEVATNTPALANNANALDNETILASKCVTNKFSSRTVAKRQNRKYLKINISSNRISVHQEDNSLPTIRLHRTYQFIKTHNPTSIQTFTE